MSSHCRFLIASLHHAQISWPDAPPPAAVDAPLSGAVMHNLKRITREDIPFGQAVITVEMPFSEFVQKFGEKHSDRPPDRDAAEPVELWFFELPWGQRITLEYHLTIGQFDIYLGLLEVDAVLDYLELRDKTCYLHHEMIRLLKNTSPKFFEGLGKFDLYRQDDNGNKIFMKSYESQRVADYYRKLYEERGHKQLYWVEKEHA